MQLDKHEVKQSMSLTSEAKVQKIRKPNAKHKVDQASHRWLIYESIEEEEKTPSLQGTSSSSVLFANQPAQF